MFLHLLTLFSGLQKSDGWCIINTTWTWAPLHNMVNPLVCPSQHQCITLRRLVARIYHPHPCRKVQTVFDSLSRSLQRCHEHVVLALRRHFGQGNTAKHTVLCSHLQHSQQNLLAVLQAAVYLLCTTSAFLLATFALYSMEIWLQSSHFSYWHKPLPNRHFISPHCIVTERLFTLRSKGEGRREKTVPFLDLYVPERMKEMGGKSESFC